MLLLRAPPPGLNDVTDCTQQSMSDHRRQRRTKIGSAPAFVPAPRDMKPREQGQSVEQHLALAHTYIYKTYYRVCKRDAPKWRWGTRVARSAGATSEAHDPGYLETPALERESSCLYVFLSTRSLQSRLTAEPMDVLVPDARYRCSCSSLFLGAGGKYFSNEPITKRLKNLGE